MDHVEECPSYYVDCWGTICYCDYDHICMCRELRACEERVRGEEQQRIEAALKSVGQHDASWELAVRDKALRDAGARSAVTHDPLCYRSHDQTLGNDPFCQCAALAKAREDERSNNFTPDDHSNGMTEAYQRGLDAAREAVKGVNWFNDDGKMLSAIVATAESLAAIDALRKP